MDFSWLPFFKEVMDYILKTCDKYTLCDHLQEIYIEVIGEKINDSAKKGAHDTLLKEVDPLTFIAYFNRNKDEEKRINLCRSVKERFSISSDLPKDFKGIPMFNPQKTWFFPYLYERKKEIDLLWSFAKDIAKDKINEENFNKIYNIKHVGTSKISQLLFLIHPEKYFPFDKNSQNKIEFTYKKKEEKENSFKLYLRFLDAVKEKNPDVKPYEYSSNAYLSSKRSKSNETSLMDGVSKNNEESPSFWWLNANPEMWDLRSLSVGDRKCYTTYNERGNKRKVYKNFKQLEQEDLVIGYTTAPVQEVTDILKVSKGIHDDAEDGKEKVEFEKVKSLKEPLSRKVLIENNTTQNVILAKAKQGSLHGLNKDQYSEIMKLVCEGKEHLPEKKHTHTDSKFHEYSKEDALKELLIDKPQLDEALNVLKLKKNLLLYGPPGVGKSFLAERLPWIIQGSKSESTIKKVVFSGNYEYASFIGGFGTDSSEKSGFGHRKGEFYNFVLMAQKNLKKDYFFIIEEFNRANVEKVLGEAFHVIEKTKRGKKNAVTLKDQVEYDGPFWIPENLYIIGTMNKVDSSVNGQLDNGLKRRFGRFKLEPLYNTENFNSLLKKNKVPDRVIKTINNTLPRINEKIIEADDLGEDLAIGHSYFCDSPPSIEQDSYNWYRTIIEGEIIPLLEDIFIDVKERESVLESCQIK